MRVRFAIVFALCVSSCFAFTAKVDAVQIDPSQLVVDRWTSRDGLPEGALLSLYEDSIGQLWIGTECCIVRFDGFNFHTLSKELAQFGQHSFARAIEADGDGGFWVALVGGAAHYSGGKFEWYGAESGLTHPFVYDILPNSPVWVGTGGDGLWALQDGVYQREASYQGMPAKINDIESSLTNTLLVATDFGLVERRTNGDWLFADDTLGIHKILVTSAGDTLLAHDDGVARLLDSGKIEPVEALVGLPIYSLFEGASGGVWAGGDNALFRIDTDGVKSISHSFGRTNALLEDASNNLWLAGAGGLVRLKKGVVSTVGEREGLPHDSILAVAPHKKGGLWVIDDRGSLGHWLNGIYKEIEAPGEISGRGMLGMAVDAAGNLWLANGSLNRWDDDDDRTVYSLPESAAAIVEIAENGLWLGQTQADGLSSIHFIDQEFLNPEALQGALQSNIPLSIPFAVRHVQRIYPSKISNHIWIATGGTGLIKYDVASGAAENYSEQQGLPSNYVYSMVEDSDGALWVATRSGIARIKDANIVGFSSVAGMPTRSPVHLFLDHQDRFWITSDDGVHVVPRQSLLSYIASQDAKVLSRKLTTRDGLRGLVVSWRRNGQSVSDQHWLQYATTQGLSSIDTRVIEFGGNTPDIIIDRVILGADLIESRPVQITHREQHLEVHFSAPDLSESHRLEFRSRLIRNGHESEAPWSSGSTNRYLLFSNLAHGQYQVEINAHIIGEPWGQVVTRLPIYVQPRLYERSSVKIIFVVSMIGLALLWARRRLKIAESVEVDLRNRVEERTSELRQEVEFRKVAEKSASELAKDLDRRVQERTAQLELAKMATRRSEERFALAVKGAEDGIWDWDITVNQLYLSPRWLNIIGYVSKDFSIHMDNWFSVVHADDVGRLRDIFVFRNTHSSFRLEYRMRHRRGHYVWVLTRGVVVRDDEGAPVRAAGSQTDISSRKAVEDQLLWRQTKDVVTGLPNRLLFSDRLNQSLIQGRNKTTQIAIIFIDIDQFRSINERFGHEVGDKVLQQSSQRIAKCLRTEDSVARVGNDEFAILIHDVESESDLKVTADRVLNALAQPMQINGQDLSITCSMGLKLCSNTDATAEDCLIDSEQAVSHAKISGGAQLARFDSRVEKETKARRLIEEELQQGLKDEDFVLYYQPMVNPSNGDIVGLEALARWQHPSRGLLSPYHFIGLLEACGLIVPFSRWVLKTACHQAKVWQSLLTNKISISINVPAHQLSNEGFYDEVKQVLEQEDLEAGSLCLEIVESSLLESQPAVIENLNKIRSCGVKIAIDDFGTGYSAFSYLDTFPVDRVKIDRTFCESVPEKPKANAILSSLLTMIRDLDLEPVVEGVETEGQRDYLLSEGGPIIQGYYYFKPMPAQECQALIEARLKK